MNVIIIKKEQVTLLFLLTSTIFIFVGISLINPYNTIINTNNEDEIQNIDNIDLKTSAPLDPRTGYAIVVGISDYPGTSNDLSYCDDDAIEVLSMLINDYNFEPSNIIYLQDSSATRDAISNAFDTIASQADSNDVFCFYYSGHGGTEYTTTTYSTSISSPHPYSNNLDRFWSITRSGAAQMRVHFSRLEVETDCDYVLLGDSDLYSGYYYYAYTGQYYSGLWSSWVPLLPDGRLVINLYTDYSITDWGFNIDQYQVRTITPSGTQYLCPYDSLTSSAYSYWDDLLDSKLDSLPCAEKYVISDSCHSGGMIPESQASGRYMMMACEADEYSLEDPSRQNGCFTYYFLRGLDYATDSDGNGIISMEEVYNYAYSNTVSRSSSLGYTHHPTAYDGITGPAIMQPALGPVSFDVTGNQLDYSFDLYGTGAIQDISIFMAHVNSTDIITDTQALNSSAPSSTGFGHYEDSISLSGANGINSYGLIVEIQGNQLITLNDTFYGDYDGDTIDDMTEIQFGLNASTPDTDSDGLNDAIEYYGITDPWNNDTDGDNMTDGYEYYNNLNNTIDDSGDDYDEDGLTNLEEFLLGTYANDNDSDNDALLDYDEINTYYTNAANPDTDGDGLSDGFEILTYITDATNPDTDGDGMTDGYEYNNDLDNTIDDSGDDYDGDGLTNVIEYTLGSYANNTDSDSDTIPDIYEYNNNLDLMLDDTSLDYDGDGLSNLIEYTEGSYANNPDSDGDTMTDGYEYYNDLDLSVDDTGLDYDSDGLTNLEEYQLNTYANNNDTDGDILLDGDEINTYYTNATNPDTDEDGLTDGFEALTIGSSPTNPDSDGDTMTDGYEYNNDLDLTGDDSGLDYDADGLTNLLEFTIGSYANNTDSDGDIMPDFYEYNNNLNLMVNDAGSDYDIDGLNNLLEFNIGTYANNIDSDGDLMSDGYEYNNNLNYSIDDADLDYDNDGLNNLIEYNEGSYANNPDSDGDTMPDYYEYNHNLNLMVNDANLDYDADGLNNLLECSMGCNASDSDSDHDGLMDGLEYYNYGTQIMNPDSDQDGLTDGEEVNLYNTQPLIADTDGDGFADGLEVAMGLDPLNPRSSMLTIYLNIGGIALLLVVVTYSTRATVVHAKQRTKNAKKFDGSIKYKGASENYNALRVDEKTKVKPTPSYGYYRPSTSQTRISTGDIPSNMTPTQLRSFFYDFVQNRLPRPYSKSELAGQKALIIGNMALKAVQDLRVEDALNYIFTALKMGVPEPMNSQFKSLLLNLVEGRLDSSGSQGITPNRPNFQGGTPSSSPSQQRIFCNNCGKENNKNNKFCINCGRSI